MSVTWRSKTTHNVSTRVVKSDEADDWETDPDFVVRFSLNICFVHFIHSQFKVDQSKPDD